MIFIFDYLRGAGTLIGLATGDALGAPLEGLKAKKEVYSEMISGGLHYTGAGGITDDTLSALAICESLIENEGFSPEDIAFRICSEFLMHPQFFGPTSAEVFISMLKGKNPFEISKRIGERGGGTTNGSVMRGAPIGIFFPPDKTRMPSIVCSRITHYNPVSCECSAFVNNMISRMCRGEDRNTAFTKAFSECEIKRTQKILSQYKKYPMIPSLDSLQATHCALSVFMESKNFEEMLILAVNMGGDTDTIGAVCGAMGGALWGCNEIPLRWRGALKESGRIENDAFRLADVSL
ncbi:ADP-ribosylglycohydrolase family protein [Methanomicrobium sp. W14]|uniref:ADP-ribosylglycohydrolase family protein n=1 Tax=Methanomicrobium sp. W14 TaxID=2817839 RepID=UPI0032AFAD30